MNKASALIVAGLVATGLMVTGCGGGGADASSKNEIRTTTTGQELSDLKKALDQGAITQEEYEDQRQKILERDD